MSNGYQSHFGLRKRRYLTLARGRIDAVKPLRIMTTGPTSPCVVLRYNFAEIVKQSGVCRIALGVTSWRQ